MRLANTVEVPAASISVQVSVIIHEPVFTDVDESCQGCRQLTERPCYRQHCSRSSKKQSKLVRLFLNGAIKIVRTASWPPPHYLNKNVFSERQAESIV